MTTRIDLTPFESELLRIAPVDALRHPSIPTEYERIAEVTDEERALSAMDRLEAAGLVDHWWDITDAGRAWLEANWVTW